MKFVQTLFLLAAVLLSLTDARISEGSQRTLKNVKTKMIHKYGMAFEKLVHPQTGQMNMLLARPEGVQKQLKAKHHERLSACEDEDACITIEGYEIGYEEPAAWWYGFITG